MEIGALLLQRVLSQLRGPVGPSCELSASHGEASPPPTVTYCVSLLCEPRIVVRQKNGVNFIPSET